MSGTKIVHLRHLVKLLRADQLQEPWIRHIVVLRSMAKRRRKFIFVTVILPIFIAWKKYRTRRVSCYSTPSHIRRLFQFRLMQIWFLSCLFNQKKEEKNERKLQQLIEGSNGLMFVHADNILCSVCRMFGILLKINLVEDRVPVAHKFPCVVYRNVVGHIPSSFMVLHVNGVVFAASHSRVVAASKYNNVQDAKMLRCQRSEQVSPMPNGMRKTTIHLFLIGPVLENHPQHRFGGKIIPKENKKKQKKLYMYIRKMPFSLVRPLI